MIHSFKNELKLFVTGYFKREYPEYILKNRWTDDIPVFFFHHISHIEFEAHLRYLKQNDYQTLTTDQLELSLQDRQAVPKRSVVITFDDGLDDVYEVVYPLLKQYDYKAVVFLIPNWVDKPGLVSWEQVKELHESGIIDFQSHSMNHPAIFASPRLINFYHPGFTQTKPWNVPLICSDLDVGNTHLPALGTPIYEYNSRFSDVQRFYPDQSLRQICEDYVKQNGNEDFFSQKNWKRALVSRVKQYQKIHPDPDRFETQAEQRSHILSELLDAKQAIERRLSHKTVRHFAAPWHQIGLLTLKLLAKSGYKTAFMGLSLPRLDHKTEKKVTLIRRVSGDFIPCLFGDGRRSFRSVLLHKMIRRIQKGVTY